MTVQRYAAMPDSGMTVQRYAAMPDSGMKHCAAGHGIPSPVHCRTAA